MSQFEDDSHGWIKHDGKGIPKAVVDLTGNQYVIVEFRDLDRSTLHRQAACCLEWTHTGHEGDVYAYAIREYPSVVVEGKAEPTSAAASAGTSAAKAGMKIERGLLQKVEALTREIGELILCNQGLRQEIQKRDQVERGFSPDIVVGESSQSEFMALPKGTRLYRSPVAGLDLIQEAVETLDAHGVNPVLARRLAELYNRTEQVEAPEHPDDLAVDRFAAAMKSKMAESRAKGRRGWDDPAQCSVESLAALLIDHLIKGDPVDIGNFAMMLHQRGADLGVLRLEAKGRVDTAKPVRTLDDIPPIDPEFSAEYWSDLHEAGNIVPCEAPQKPFKRWLGDDSEAAVLESKPGADQTMIVPSGHKIEALVVSGGVSLHFIRDEGGKVVDFDLLGADLEFSPEDRLKMIAYLVRLAECPTDGDAKYQVMRLLGAVGAHPSSGWRNPANPNAALIHEGIDSEGGSCD